MTGIERTRKCIVCAFVIACLTMAATAQAEWEADPNNKKQVKAAEVIAAFKERIPRTVDYFNDAYGYAILPSVTRVGFGFGGAYGRGFVIERDTIVGTTRYYQFSSGIQAGARYFAMIVFFRDREALEYYKTAQLQFAGQAGLAVLTGGIAGTPAYNEGVAIVTMTRLGLMGEFSASGVRYTYKPLANE